MIKATGDGRPDYLLIGTILLLLVIGLLALSSAGASFSQSRFGSTYSLLNHQIIFGLLPGILLGFLAFRVRLDFLKKWTPALFFLNLVLLLVVFLPKISGSAKVVRWISIGSFSFQPSELLKLTFVLYLASWLDSRKKELAPLKKSFGRTFIAFLVLITLISLPLIFQPDISTLVVIVSVAVLMYFLDRTPLSHSILIVSIGAVGLFALIKIASYRMSRLLVFLNPGVDPMGAGYQIKQALIGIGSGGITGLGLGMSGQKFGFLPGAISDSIFAIMAEETGFIGALILVSLFLVFFWRGFRIGKNSPDTFSRLLAFGISFWIIIQAFVNIGSMIRILPLTGIPLPFISYGGSALITELIGMGLLLNLSRN